jgi:two-component system, NarL family, nitrate/nitrite response regulator NarL
MYEIIVADNQELYRTGIVELISRHDEFRIVAQLSDWSLLLAALAENWKSLVIASTSLVCKLEELVTRAQRVSSRVLLVIDDSDFPHHYRSLGVAGIVRRSSSASALVDSLRRIQRGSELVFVAEQQRQNHQCAGVSAVARLSTMEMRLVALLMKGFKNKRIAEILSISEQGVRSKFQKIFDKTGMSTRLELALFVTQHRAFALAAADTYARIEASMMFGSVRS